MWPSFNRNGKKEMDWHRKNFLANSLNIIIINNIYDVITIMIVALDEAAELWMRTYFNWAAATIWNDQWQEMFAKKWTKPSNQFREMYSNWNTQGFFPDLALNSFGLLDGVARILFLSTSFHSSLCRCVKRKRFSRFKPTSVGCTILGPFEGRSTALLMEPQHRWTEVKQN